MSPCVDGRIDEPQRARALVGLLAVAVEQPALQSVQEGRDAEREDAVLACHLCRKDQPINEGVPSVARSPNL